VEHQPGDPVDQNKLRRRRIIAQMLNETVPGGGKKATLPISIINSTST
jgi:hypothetical protein